MLEFFSQRLPESFINIAKVNFMSTVKCLNTTDAYIEADELSANNAQFNIMLEHCKSDIEGECASNEEII